VLTFCKRHAGLSATAGLSCWCCNKLWITWAAWHTYSLCRLIGINWADVSLIISLWTLYLLCLDAVSWARGRVSGLLRILTQQIWRCVTMAATIAVSVMQSCLDYAQALIYGTGQQHLWASVCVELSTRGCSASLTRSSQQQSPTSSLASCMQADSIQNCSYNIQQSVKLTRHLTSETFYTHTDRHSGLHSASQNLLCIFCTTNFRRSAFSFSAPAVWNKWPTAIMESNTLDTF